MTNAVSSVRSAKPNGVRSAVRLRQSDGHVGCHFAEASAEFKGLILLKRRVLLAGSRWLNWEPSNCYADLIFSGLPGLFQVSPLLQ